MSARMSAALADATNSCPAAAPSGKAAATSFSAGDTVWYTASDGEERKARVTKVGGDELDLNIREEADSARVRPRDGAADASDEEEDYGHLAGSSFEVGDTVWYTSSDGEELKGRVRRVEGDEIDLNIREEADLDRVRARDAEDEASDDDEYDHLSDDDEEEEEEEEDSGEYEKDGKVFSADGTELYSVEDRESYFAHMETDD
jgi:hypothetical protein